MGGVVHWAADVSDDWDSVRRELTRAFGVSRDAAIAEQSIVYVVHEDDLLGRRGPGNAMVATGLLSAARTAALEGTRKNWTANVVAHDESAERSEIEKWVALLLESNQVTGELIRIGPGHIGKALA
jgi:hypothetical protein